MPITSRCFLFPLHGKDYKITYYQWGAVDADPVIGVHGLLLNGRDFDFIGQDIAEHGKQILAIDLPGRGLSDALENPDDYSFDVYYNAILAMLDHANLRNRSCDWIGTSLGGLLAMGMMGRNLIAIDKLVLNDIGYTAPKEALDFIAYYAQTPKIFQTYAEGRQFIQQMREPNFGRLDADHWDHIAKHTLRQKNDQWVYHYDPAIGQQFAKEPLGKDDLKQAWQKHVTCPTLLIHGEKSQILTNDIIDDMDQSRTAPHFIVHKIPECGHVPPLMNKNQRDLVTNFLFS